MELEFESLQKEKLELDQDLERERSQKEEVEARLAEFLIVMQLSFGPCELDKRCRTNWLIL